MRTFFEVKILFSIISILIYILWAQSIGLCEIKGYLVSQARCRVWLCFWFKQRIFNPFNYYIYSNTWDVVYVNNCL